MNTQSKKKKLILIEMNELNYKFVREYLKKIDLPSLKKIVGVNTINTTSENEYKNLEPWIQWTSVHTGKKANEHGIFRLGDIINSDLVQIFEIVEDRGFSVGCVSPMNAANRLSNKSTFIPDPWTQTNSDSSWWSRNLSSMISQAVNDNSSGKLSLKSIIIILIAFLRFVRPKKYLRTILLALTSIGKPWRKALFFDRLIHEINLRLIKSKKLDFNTVFFNSMAHIQHHYIFNSSAYNGNLKNPYWYIKDNFDPFFEGLLEFDDILFDYIHIEDYEYLIATGLTQNNYDKLDFYWRIKNHDQFIKYFGIKYKKVIPRMTRDFLIEFNNETEKKNAIQILSEIKEKETDKKLFEHIDERSNSIFVTLTYSHDLKNKYIYLKDREMSAEEAIVFVAIKNGEHCGDGFLSYSNGIKHILPLDTSHVSNIFNTLNNFFESRR